MVYVYYDAEYENFINNMSKENKFIIFKHLNFKTNHHKNTTNNIYILNSNKTYDINSNKIISIDYTNFNINNALLNLSYDIKKVYMFFYNLFIVNNNDRNFIITYNIYNKILNLIDKTKYIIKFPIIFDAVETYLLYVLTNKSFIRIGDGEQTIPNKGFSNILAKQIYNNTVKTLNPNYSYDKEKIVLSYNEIFYDGYKMISTKRNPNYWNKKSIYFSLQQKYQSKFNVYYSSHCFRLNSKLENMYSRFNINSISLFLSRIFINKDIIVIDAKSNLDPFYNYSTRINICYGVDPKYPSYNCLTQKTTDFVLTTLQKVLNLNPTKNFVIFVKGACLSNLIVNTYYKKYRVCDIGSFSLTIDKTKVTSQNKPIVYNIN